MTTEQIEQEREKGTNGIFWNDDINKYVHVRDGILTTHYTDWIVKEVLEIHAWENEGGTLNEPAD